MVSVPLVQACGFHEEERARGAHKKMARRTWSFVPTTATSTTATLSRRRQFLQYASDALSTHRGISFSALRWRAPVRYRIEMAPL